MKSKEEDYGLTCGQRWLLHLLEQAPELARPVQRVYRLSSAFDSSAFLEALQGLLHTHPALRLQLVRNKSGWRQRFPKQDAYISGEEILGRTPEMRMAYASILIAEEAKGTMDLRKEPPIKAKIIKVNGEYLLSMCIDHLAADEIAFDLFEQELLSYYQQVIHANFVHPSLSTEFLTYASQEGSQKFIEHENLLYWQQQLGDASLNRNDPKNFWVPASVFRYQFKRTTFESLLNFCRAHKCSLFHFIVAVQLILLNSAGNSNDIVLNIPISNRVRARERSIIANLSMLLHVRFSLIENESITQLITKVRDQILFAMSHRQYDYPSLSRFMAAKAKKAGGHISWLLGCNFIADYGSLTCPNLLFKERTDNFPGRSYDIPCTSFTVAARQKGTELWIDIDWDAMAWPIGNVEMEAKIEEILHRFLE